MFCYPIHTQKVYMYRQGVGILFRSVKFSVLLSVWKISALLRDLQKVAASKPISWVFRIYTTLFSLNNNFGTLLTLVLGCFPLDIQPYRTMSDYLILIYRPSENKYPLIESSRPPNFRKNIICLFNVFKTKSSTKSIMYVAWDHNSVPSSITFKLPTYIGFAETDLPL